MNRKKQLKNNRTPGDFRRVFCILREVYLIGEKDRRIWEDASHNSRIEAPDNLVFP